MSLLSLLIALMADRVLSNRVWRFDHYYSAYLGFFNKKFTAVQGKIASSIFIILPVLVTLFLVNFIDNNVVQLILSTLILIVCLGCFDTRQRYKDYLQSAYRGEETTTDMHRQQLLTDKNLPEMGFGQALIWLNYRYYIAIMLYFVVFGPAGAVFYRLLSTVIEQQNNKVTGSALEHCADLNTEVDTEVNIKINTQVNDDAIFTGPDGIHNSEITPDIRSGCKSHHDVLFWLDWLPVRIASFGYMFVGHFSQAMPTWLESIFDAGKPTYKVLIDVAQKSEDILVNNGDCIAEPCLLVRLAKRNLLLILAIISVLTLTGVIN